jgi:hypothetical protein
VAKEPSTVLRIAAERWAAERRGDFRRFRRAKSTGRPLADCRAPDTRAADFFLAERPEGLDLAVRARVFVERVFFAMALLRSLADREGRNCGFRGLLFDGSPGQGFGRRIPQL